MQQYSRDLYVRRSQDVKKHKRKRRNAIIAVVVALVVIGAIAAVALLVVPNWQSATLANKEGTENTFDFTGNPPNEKQTDELVKQADLLAAGYDYEAAILLLESAKDYEQNSTLTDAIARYRTAMEALTSVDVDSITHIFTHSLISFPAWTFSRVEGNDFRRDDYNQNYLMADEFSAILESMYEKGFVLVSIHDMYDVTQNDDGTRSISRGTIRLPEGKKPYVLSIDDVCYYEYMTGDGFPTKIVIDENGKPTCLMTLEDGTVTTGEYDVVPIVERFIEKHPDASYQGARGIIALTGYDGVLGYRTDPEYASSAYTDEHPDFDYEKECADAKAVADTMKSCGWEFASHSWGHRYYGKISYDEMVTDMERWLSSVVPITGETDVMIYAFGNNIADWHEYAEDNSKFTYLRSKGFNAYCGVDASVKSWVQFGSTYMRQDRRNLDGYRMWQDISNPSLGRLSDLFDASSVFNYERPTPVPDY